MIRKKSILFFFFRFAVCCSQFCLNLMIINHIENLIFVSNLFFCRFFNGTAHQNETHLNATMKNGEIDSNFVVHTMLSTNYWLRNKNQSLESTFCGDKVPLDAIIGWRCEAIKRWRCDNRRHRKRRSHFFQQHFAVTKLEKSERARKCAVVRCGCRRCQRWNWCHRCN